MSKESYEARFIVQRPEKSRDCSTAVYILPSVAHQAKLILSSSEYRGVTLQSYINNILVDHFKKHGDDIGEIKEDFIRRYTNSVGKEVADE